MSFIGDIKFWLAKFMVQAVIGVAIVLLVYYGISALVWYADWSYRRKQRGPYRHHKRGGKYVIMGLGMLQTETPLRDGEMLYAYRDEDGRWWFRRPVEFHDGRFELIGKGGKKK